MTGTFKFIFSNDGKPLIVILEPWCSELSLPTGSTITIYMDYKSIDYLETAITENYLTIYLWQQGRIKIIIDKVDVTPSFLRE